MKTLFQLGLPRNNNFWMGQNLAPAGTKIDTDALCSKLNPSIDTYNKVVAFIKNPNYRQQLGDQASTFDDLKGKADAIYESVVGVQGSVCLGGAGSVGDVSLDNSYYFIGIMNSMDSIMSYAKPAATAVKPMPQAPVAAGPSPLLIGGVAVAAIGLVALLA